MELSKPYQRLNAIIKHLNVSYTAFVEMLNARTAKPHTRQWLNNYLNSDIVIKDYDVIAAIKDIGYSTNWYITGEGEMLLANEKLSVPIYDMEIMRKMTKEQIIQAKKLHQKNISIFDMYLKLIEETEK